MGLRHYPFGKRVDADSLDIMHDMSTALLRLHKTAGNRSLKGGGATATDDLLLYPNTAASQSYLELSGNGGITLKTITNRNIRLWHQGTGKVQFGTYTVLGAETSAGFITINDENGNARKLLVVA